MVMTATLLYRIASVLLVLFAVGHTVGFFAFIPDSPEGRAVLDSMNHVQFQVGGATFTYGLFYTGFGLFATAYLLFAAFLAWRLGALARTNPTAIGSLGWGFFILQVASLVLSRMYFLLPPTVLSALVAICTGLAAWMVQTARA
jgi:hypothetical protein